MKWNFLLVFLLSFLGMFAQDVTRVADTAYFARQSLDGRIIYREVAYGVQLPRNYDPSRKYPVVIVVHGIGERSNGTVEDLRNLMMGFNYGGTRLYPLASDDLKKAVNDYQIISVIPTYKDNFSVANVNWLLNDLSKQFNIDTTKRGLVGFSLGGGAVVRYITSSLENSKRLLFAVAAAPVSWATDWSNVARAPLQFLAITAQTDPTVPSSNIINMVAALRAQKPTFDPWFKIVPGTGHGGLNEALSLSNANFPQNIYSYLTTTSTVVRRQYPVSGGGGPVEPPVVIPPAPNTPVIVRDPVPAITTTGLVDLSACSTTGSTYTYWSVISVPKGASLYTNVFGSSGYCKTTAKFTVEGAYGLTVTATNGSQKAVDTFYITYQKTSIPVPKVAKYYANGVLYFTDNTFEPAMITGVTPDKRVTAKTGDAEYIF